MARLSPRLRLALGAVCALLLVTEYIGALRWPFINDDYIFLDKTRALSFAGVWAARDLLFHYYRPWSRELHYWVLQHAFGARELPFHLASWALWLAVMAGYAGVVAALAGPSAAAIATLGLAVLAVWVVPITWAAGAQDLWMLGFALVFLEAHRRGRTALALAALALALLSKETAALLAPIAIVADRLVAGRSLRDIARRALPAVALTAVWALLHPLLGGRLWAPIHDAIPPGLHPPVLELAARTVLATLNVVARPAPETGWGRALLAGAPVALAAAGVVMWAARGGRARAITVAPPARLIAYGLAWAALGWAPLLLPSLGWRVHYGALGAMGAWLALAVALRARPVAAAGLVCAVALLLPIEAATPSHDWSMAWYRARAAEFMGAMRTGLLRQRPAVPPHTRFYFVRVPSDVGMLAGDGPALRVWYGDSTVRAGFYSDYRPRAAGAAAGPDYFYRYDAAAGWIEVREGREDADRARAENPRWSLDHENLGRTLATAGEWPRAVAEFEKLARADSTRFENAFNVGVCYEGLGDSAAAARWYARAAALPGADDAARDQARRFAPHLRAPR